MSEWKAGEKKFYLTHRLYFKDRIEPYKDSRVGIDADEGGIITLKDSLRNEPEIESIVTEVEVFQPWHIDFVHKKGKFISTGYVVGILNSRDINFIQENYRSNEGKFENYLQLVFTKNHEPRSSSDYGSSGPGWGKWEEPILTDIMWAYMSQLMKIKPSISDNLTKCLNVIGRHYKNPDPKNF